MKSSTFDPLSFRVAEEKVVERGRVEHLRGVECGRKIGEGNRVATRFHHLRRAVIDVKAGRRAAGDDTARDDEIAPEDNRVPLLMVETGTAVVDPSAPLSPSISASLRVPSALKWGPPLMNLTTRAMASSEIEGPPAMGGISRGAKLRIAVRLFCGR